MTHSKPQKIALTGGIGSGKSTVAELFATEHQVPVIDADQIARDIVPPGSALLNEIRERFGASVIDAQGQLIRSKLREIVFAEQAQRLWLENLLHPEIQKQMHAQSQAVSAPYCLLVIPLLNEKHVQQDDLRILVVDSPEDLQVQRTQQRDACSVAQVQAIMATQTPRKQRLAWADDVIHNNADLPHLQQQVAALHQFYAKFKS